MKRIQKTLFVLLVAAGLATAGCADSDYQDVIEGGRPAAAVEPTPQFEPDLEQPEPEVVDTRQLGDAPSGPRSFVRRVTIDAIGRAGSLEAQGNIKIALGTFMADNGRYPQTQEEFMEKIIAENGIQLPRLEPNEEYEYDPDELVLNIIEYDRALEPGETDPPR